jgi:hypothetical protein
MESYLNQGRVIMIKIKRMTAGIGLVLAALISNSLPVSAQEPTAPVVGTWDAIKALPSRDDLTVTLKDGNTKMGKLTDATEFALILSQGKKLTEIRRDGIFQIYRSIPKSRSRATGTGAFVGAGLGVATAVFGDGSSGRGSSPGTSIVGIVLMTGMGALIGRAISGGKERVLIYEARK